jgi:predicted transcriptional regulator of viral defense system
VVFAATPKFLRPRLVLGTDFRFVRCKTANLFGIISHWATKTDKVQVSDLERTVIDGLKQSEHCGGFSEVAKGFWMRREEINLHRLVDYSLRLDVGAVIRRLGFLLELFEVDAPGDLDRLRERLSATYAILDPMLPNEGKLLARWRLKLNIRPEEIQSVVRT